VKFLIDRCAGRTLADRLRAEGHDVVESQEWGADPGDVEILRRAAAERRVLVIMDKDFGSLVFMRGERHCGLIRLPDVPARLRSEIVRQILDDHGRDLELGAVLTARGSRIRVSWAWPRSEG
jgi:predicted nuclease of predicted toxin-antitoxin system